MPIAIVAATWASTPIDRMVLGVESVRPMDGSVPGVVPSGQLYIHACLDAGEE